MNGMTERTALLLGEAAMEKLAHACVAVVGLGGVGGHCAEALARAGVGRLHLIDCDTVAVSNMNRQIVATKSTIGMRKTDAMAARIADVSDCNVSTIDIRIDADTVESAFPAPVDCMVDAIDSLAGKLALAEYAGTHHIPILSCMGAGNRLDPTQFAVMDVFETQNDPLARNMRRELRKRGIPTLPVVCSTEIAHTFPGQRTIGSLAPVTATAGLCAAGWVIRKLTGV